MEASLKTTVAALSVRVQTQIPSAVLAGSQVKADRFRKTPHTSGVNPAVIIPGCNQQGAEEVNQAIMEVRIMINHVI
jgi:hypothetical protein